MTLTLHVQVLKMQKFIIMIRQMSELFGKYFWCELGYHHDLNMVAEKGYLPFQIILFCRTRSVRDKIVAAAIKIVDSQDE